MAKVQGGKEEEEMEWELEKGVVSGVGTEEESLDVSQRRNPGFEEVLDWRKAVVEEVQEESFGTGTHSAEDSKTTVGKEAKSGEFSRRDFRGGRGRRNVIRMASVPKFVRVVYTRIRQSFRWVP